VDNATYLFKQDLHKTIYVHTLQPLYPVISVPGILVISWWHAWFMVLFDFYLAVWRGLMLELLEYWKSVSCTEFCSVM